MNKTMLGSFIFTKVGKVFMIIGDTDREIVRAVDVSSDTTAFSGPNVEELLDFINKELEITKIVPKTRIRFEII